MDKIDYILDAVVARGYNSNLNECNDFFELLKRKEFKDLVALELYECYFWEDRHEFDLQLLRELVESTCAFLYDPDTVIAIRTGLLLTLPSVIVLRIVDYIWAKLKSNFLKKAPLENPEKTIIEGEISGWACIKNNLLKIDEEFKNHDYVLADNIDTIFDASREQIEPLLKICGFKCYFDKKRSIWIKPGLPVKKIREILKKHSFKNR